jgi:hypothetical protein
MAVARCAVKSHRGILAFAAVDVLVGGDQAHRQRIDQHLESTALAGRRLKLPVAVPSTKGHWRFWGVESSLFHQGFASHTIVARVTSRQRVAEVWLRAYHVKGVQLSI